MTNLFSLLMREIWQLNRLNIHVVLRKMSHCTNIRCIFSLLFLCTEAILFRFKFTCGKKKKKMRHEGQTALQLEGRVMTGTNDSRMISYISGSFSAAQWLRGTKVKKEPTETVRGEN